MHVPVPGFFTSIPNSDDASNKDITIEELCSCIKRLKRGKSPGIDGILPDMIKDGGELVKQSLLWLFSCCLRDNSLNVYLWA